MCITFYCYWFNLSQLDRKPFPEWYVYYGGDPAKAPKRIEDLK